MKCHLMVFRTVLSAENYERKKRHTPKTILEKNGYTYVSKCQLKKSIHYEIIWLLGNFELIQHNHNKARYKIVQFNNVFILFKTPKSLNTKIVRPLHFKSPEKLWSPR